MAPSASGLLAWRRLPTQLCQREKRPKKNGPKVRTGFLIRESQAGTYDAWELPLQRQPHRLWRSYALWRRPAGGRLSPTSRTPPAPSEGSLHLAHVCPIEYWNCHLCKPYVSCYHKTLKDIIENLQHSVLVVDGAALYSHTSIARHQGVLHFLLELSGLKGFGIGRLFRLGLQRSQDEAWKAPSGQYLGFRFWGEGFSGFGGRRGVLPRLLGSIQGSCNSSGSCYAKNVNLKRNTANGICNYSCSRSNVILRYS